MKARPVLVRWRDHSKTDEDPAGLDRHAKTIEAAQVGGGASPRRRGRRPG